MEILSIGNGLELHPYWNHHLFSVDARSEHDQTIIATVSGDIALRMYAVFSGCRTNELKTEDYNCIGTLRYTVGKRDRPAFDADRIAYGTKMFMHTGLERMKWPFVFQICDERDSVQHTGLIIGKYQSGDAVVFHKDGCEYPPTIEAWKNVERLCWPKWREIETTDRWYLRCADVHEIR